MPVLKNRESLDEFIAHFSRFQHRKIIRVPDQIQKAGSLLPKVFLIGLFGIEWRILPYRLKFTSTLILLINIMLHF